MDRTFSLSSPLGNFDLIPDEDCGMVYVNSHPRNTDIQVQTREIPEWFFDPDTIWYYFGASESEDKVTAGNRIKSSIQEIT